MLFPRLIWFVFGTEVFSCPVLCTSDIVSNKQHSNGVCDPQCNSASCGFEDECLTQCAESGCTLSLLANGQCDDECAGVQCAFDRGDCGFCAGDCFAYMLQNHLCDQPCFTPACDFDHCADCAPDCFAQQVYVFEGTQFGDGTVETPYASIDLAFASIHQPTAIYLLGPRISIWESRRIESALYVQSLLCEDRHTEHCTTDFTVIDVKRPATLVVASSVTFARVKLTSEAAFGTVKFCPQIVFADGAWTHVSGGVASEDEVAAVSVCEAFKSTALFQVAGNLTLTVRISQLVTIDSLTVQPLALISIDGGHVLFEEVSISNFHTQRSGGTSAVVLSSDPRGSFRFFSGSVNFLNLAVTYSAGLALAPFLLAQYIETVEIRAVAFHFNLVVEAYSYVLGQSQSALLYLQDFYQLAIADCDFSNNFVSGGLIIVETSVVLPRDSQTIVAATHVFLSSLSFSWNLGEHCLVSVRMRGDTLNIKLERATFSRNAIEGNSVLIFQNLRALSAGAGEDQLSSSFSVQELTIAGNFAAKRLMTLSYLMNVQLLSMSITDSGDFETDALLQVYGEFAAATNSTLVPLFPEAPQCTSFFFIDACTFVSLRNVSFQRNYCYYGVCGMKFRDIDDLITITDFVSEFNDCTTQYGVSLTSEVFVNVSLARVTFRENISYEASMIFFGMLSQMELSDSVFERNIGQYGTCICLDFPERLKLTRVRFLDNLSDGSLGGGVGIWTSGEFPLTVIISDSIFQGNSARKGGAMGFSFVSTTSILMEIRNTVFVENSADLTGAVLLMEMQSVFLKGSLFHNCTFQDNHSAYGVLATKHTLGTLQISNSVFRHNYGSGAAVLMIDTQPEAHILVESVVFEDNFDGPVIFKTNSHTNSSLITRNCTFLNNRMGSVAMEGGFWQDSLSLYSASIVSQLLLSSGAIAEISAAVIKDSEVTKSGGAVHVMLGSTLRCFHCVFENNFAGYAGAAIFTEQDGAVLLDNCRFKNNTAVTGGAVLFLSSTMSAVSVVRSSIIENNNGGNFGVIFAQTAVFLLDNVTVNDNAGKSCSGITQLMSLSTITATSFFSMGGSLAAFLSLYTSSFASISESYFSDVAEASGGAIYVSSLSNVTVTNSFFFNIVAVQRGVFTVLSLSTVTLTEVTMKNIESQATGSLLYLSGSSLFIFSSVFRRFRGSGIYGHELIQVLVSDTVFGDGEGEQGGAAYFDECLQVAIWNSSFVQLTGRSGGALYFTNSKSTAPGTVVISNSLFAENQAEVGGAIYCTDHQLAVSSSVFRHNSAAEGGALSLECTAPELCAYSVAASDFSGNSAAVRGGAISWLFCKPIISNTTFKDNTASYGPDFASFPIILKEQFNSSDIEIAPGQVATFAVTVTLQDHYGQRISIDNSSNAEIVSGDEGCAVSGETVTNADRGLLAFDKYIVYAKPNSTVNLEIGTEAIPPGQASDPDPHISTLHFSLKIRDCEPGEYRRSDSCEICRAGTYSFDPATLCQTCPDNAQCLGNLTVIPNSGFWRSGKFSSIMRACPNIDACLGGIVKGRALSSMGWCATGYKGNLCQSCDKGFSRTEKNMCEKCPQRDDNIIRLTFIAFSVGILVSIIVWSTLRAASRSTATHSILIRIFVNYWQLVLLVSDFKLRWQKEVLQLFKLQETIGGVVDQVYSVDCFLSNEYSSEDTFFRKSLLMAVMPLPLVGVSVLFWMCVASFKGTWRVVKEECVATVVILYFLILPSLVKSLFSIFSCSEIETDQYWLTVDLDIRCRSFTHSFYMLAVGLPGLLVWVMCVPLVCLLIVSRFKKRLSEQVMLLRFGFLISGYRLRFYYWEFVILYRKVAIICISVFISTSIPVQALTAQFVLLMSLFLQYRVQPFSQELLNAVELRSIAVADVTILCGLYFLAGATAGVGSWLLFLLIVAINVVFAAYWLSAILGQVLKSCARRSVFCRRALRPGLHRDEELEAFIAEFSVASKCACAHTLQQFYRQMLRERFQNCPNISLVASSNSSNSPLIQY